MPHSFVTPSAGSVVVWQNHSEYHGGEPLLPTLQQRGYCVTTVSQESEALQAVLERVPDLLIIYLQASGDEGYEFCKILRKLPRTSGVPVAFVGTRAQESELVNALRCGGNEYVQLPVSAEECWLRLERHLRTVHLVRSLEAEKASLHQKIWSYNHILRQQEEEQVSLAKENQVLQRLAFTDGLTKVANRHSFNEKIAELWTEAIANQQPLSLLLCDIDYFKRYNDTYGHPAGDVCLQAVADALVRGAHRHSDQVARYGGEEFAILLPATDEKGAQQVALAVQSELTRAQVTHQASLVSSHVTLSIGVCTLNPDSLQHNHDVLIHGADEALYTAKLRGRNRTVVNSADGLISIKPQHCYYSGPLESLRSIPAKLPVNQPVSQPVNQPVTQTADRPVERLAMIDNDIVSALALNEITVIRPQEIASAKEQTSFA